MALADLIKACSLSESSLKGSSSSTTSQVVGLLSVLAISGSVALFTFAGKLKLTTGEDASSDASGPLKMDDTDRLRGASAEPLKMNGRDGLIIAVEATSRPSKMDGRDSGKASRKRVRFADDVVEPRGNSHEYRMRFAQRQHEESVGRSKRHPSNSIPANRMALYKGLRQHRLQHSPSFFS